MGIDNARATSQIIFRDVVNTKHITVKNGLSIFQKKVNTFLDDGGLVLDKGILTFSGDNGTVVFNDKFHGDIASIGNKKGIVKFNNDSDIHKIGTPNHALARLVFKNARSFNLFNDIHAKRIKFGNGNFEIKNNLSINGNKICFDASHLILNNNQLTVVSSGRNNVIDFKGNINVDVNPANGKLILDGNVNYNPGTNMNFNIIRPGVVGENFHLAEIFDDTKILQDNGAPIFNIAGNGWAFDRNTYIVTSTALGNNDNNNNNDNQQQQQNQGNEQQQAKAAVAQAKAAVQKAATGSSAAKAAAQTALDKATAKLTAAKSAAPDTYKTAEMANAIAQALRIVKAEPNIGVKVDHIKTVLDVMTRNGISSTKEVTAKIKEVHQEAIIEHVLGSDKNKNATSVNAELKTLVASDIKAHIKTIANDAAKNIHKASEAAQNFDAISINLNALAKDAISDEGVKGKSNEQQAIQYIAHLQQLGSEQERTKDIAKTKSQGVDHVNVGNEAGQLIKNAVSDRLNIAAAAASDSAVRFSPWISASVSSSNQQKLYNGSNVAFTVGADVSNDDGTSFGIAYSNVNGSFKYKGNRNGDKLRANLHLGSLYGQIDTSNVVWQASDSYITGNIKGKNNILEAKGKNKLASIGYKTNGFTVDNNIGFKTATGDLTFIPNIGLLYSSYKDSAHNVKGAGVKKLVTQAVHTNALVGSAGVRVMMPQKLSDSLTITPTLTASVDNNFSRNDKVKAKLIWQQDYFDAKADSSKKSKIGYNVGAGFIIKSNNLEITASYKYRAQKQYQAHQGGIKLKVSL